MSTAPAQVRLEGAQVVPIDCFTQPISQDRLRRLKNISALFSFFRDLYGEERDAIAQALALGARVEPGEHDAWLIEQEGGGYMIPRFSKTRLRWK